VDWILDIAETDRLLAENPALADSCIDAMPTWAAQLHPGVLLRRVREIDPRIRRKSWMKPLLRTINAIAAG